MAYTFWLLAKSKNLPGPAEVSRTVHLSDFPLEIDADRDWQDLVSWLPMFWNGRESGYEIDFEVLGHEDATAVSKAGFIERE